jgi:MFS family permease
VAVYYAEGFWHLLLIGCTTGALGAVAMPALTALAADEGQHSGMGAVMGVLNMAMSAGMMLGPVLAGALAEVVELRSLFVFAAVVGVLGTLGFMRLTTEPQGSAVSATEIRERQTESG